MNVPVLTASMGFMMNVSKEYSDMLTSGLNVACQ